MRAAMSYRTCRQGSLSVFVTNWSLRKPFCTKQRVNPLHNSDAAWCGKMPNLTLQHWEGIGASLMHSDHRVSSKQRTASICDREINTIVSILFIYYVFLNLIFCHFVHIVYALKDLDSAFITKCNSLPLMGEGCWKLLHETWILNSPYLWANITYSL